jgi:hypothetical protein
MEVSGIPKVQPFDPTNVPTGNCTRRGGMPAGLFQLAAWGTVENIGE